MDTGVLFVAGKKAPARSRCLHMMVRMFLQGLPVNTVAAGDFGCAPKAQYREKLVATVSRRESVYKRAGEPSETFHERGGAAA